MLAVIDTNGVSLNQYLVYALTRQVASDYTVVAWPPEAVQQQREQFEILLQRLRAASPEEIADAMAEREFVSPSQTPTPIWSSACISASTRRAQAMTRSAARHERASQH